jgi:hypothetical protein
MKHSPVFRPFMLFASLVGVVLFPHRVFAQARVAAEEALAPAPSSEASERDDRPVARKKRATAEGVEPAARQKRVVASDATPKTQTDESATIAKPAEEGIAEGADVPEQSSARQRAAAAAEAREAAASAARRERRHERRALEAEAAKLAARAAAQPIPQEKPAKTERAKTERAKPEPKRRATTAVRRGRQPNPVYRRLRDEWHAPVVEPVAPAALIDASGRIPLVISPVNGGDQVSLMPQRDDGGFSDADLEHAARAFAPKEARRTHPIAPHLLDLVYRTMRHFNAPLVHLVSGYRPDRAGSRHTQGRAIDMVIPGVTNEALADYARQLGFCGVGIYPKSGFVHLDVRESSFFWLDQSLPDERSRSEPMMPHEAEAADRAARARGEAPDTFVRGNDREDRAAARAYVKRAQKRRVLVERAAIQPAESTGSE